MARILAVDYGMKKTGIAVSDPLQIIANGLCTVAAADTLDYIVNYCKNEEVETIVVGYAKQHDGEDSESMQYIKPFFKALETKFPNLNIEWVDERFTSKIAFRSLIDSGVKKMARRNKKLVDEVSATIILQTYLEQKNY